MQTLFVKLYLYALSWQFISIRVTVNNAPDYMFAEEGEPSSQRTEALNMLYQVSIYEMMHITSDLIGNQHGDTFFLVCLL